MKKISTLFLVYAILFSVAFLVGIGVGLNHANSVRANQTTISAVSGTVK